MENKEVTLDYILESNDLLLIDASAQDTHFLEYSYGIRKIEDINLDLLDYENGNVLSFINLLNNPKIKTIEGVVEEIRVYIDKLGYKISWMAKYKEDDRKILNDQSYKISRKYINHKKQDKEYFIESLRRYHDDLYKLYKLYKNKIIEIKDKNYDLFVDMFRFLDHEINLKKDISYLYDYKDNKNNNTDEELCSALLWSSLFSNNRTGVLTRDTNFIRLLGVVPRIIGSSEFLPHNQYFRDKIKSNTPYLYFIESNVYKEMKLDHEFEDNLRIRCNNGLNENYIKERLRDIWRNFKNQ